MELSSGDAVIGMFVFLTPMISFSEGQLRAFLRKESTAHPFLTNLFQTRRTECGDQSDALEDKLFFLNGALLREVGNGFAIRRFSRDQFEKSLKTRKTLPHHQQFLEQLAKRFFEKLMAERRTSSL